MGCRERGNSSIIAHSTIITQEVVLPATIAHRHLLSPISYLLSLHDPCRETTIARRSSIYRSSIYRSSIYRSSIYRSSIKDCQSKIVNQKSSIIASLIHVGNGRAKLEPLHWRWRREICDLHHWTAGAIARKRPRTPRNRTTAAAGYRPRFELHPKVTGNLRKKG